MVELGVVGELGMVGSSLVKAVVVVNCVVVPRSAEARTGIPVASGPSHAYCRAVRQ